MLFTAEVLDSFVVEQTIGVDAARDLYRPLVRCET